MPSNANQDLWELYLQGQVAKWAAHYHPDGRPCPIGLPQFLGMTLAEYGDWVTKGTIPDRIKRSQAKTFQAFKTRRS